MFFDLFFVTLGIQIPEGSWVHRVRQIAKLIQYVYFIPAAFVTAFPLAQMQSHLQAEVSKQVISSFDAFRVQNAAHLFVDRLTCIIGYTAEEFERKTVKSFEPSLSEENRKVDRCYFLSRAFVLFLCNPFWKRTLPC